MNCPSNEDLKRLLLDEPDSGHLADHFNGCAACQGRAEVLVRSLEPLLAELPQILEPPLPAEVETHDAAAQADDTHQTTVARRVAPSASEATEAEAPVFARHRLLGQLGAGGMGFVCLAEHVDLGASRAIKFLASHRVEDPEAIQRFQREWRSIGQIEHPHLARAFDCGEESGLHFLVLEYIDGVTLADAIRHRGPLTTGQAAAIGAQVAAGLAALHAAGFVHRDVKPSNIVLGRDGVVRVIDFGLACLHDELREGNELTGTHQFVGSPAWMPPEQFHGSRATDARNDLYSLGCTLFTLVTGELPYPIAGRSIWEVAADHASPDVPDVRDHQADIDPEFAQLIRELMHPDAEQRPADAAAVQERLARFASDEDLAPIADVPAPPLSRLPEALLSRLATPARDMPDPATTIMWEQPAQPATRSLFHRVRFSAIAGLVILACLIVVIVIRRKAPPPEQPVAEAGSTETGQTETALLVPDRRDPPDPPDAAVDPPVIQRSVFPPRQLPDLPPESHDWQPDEPLSPAALTSAPRAVPGVDSWSWATRSSRGWVNTIRTSFDGSRVALGSADGCIRIYSLPNMELQRIFLGHASVASVRWVTDSTVIAADEAGTVRLWDVDRGVVLRTWDNSQTPTGDADISYDGQQVAIAGVGAGCLIRSVTDDSFLRVPRSGQAWSVSWSPAGPWLVTSNENNLRSFRVAPAVAEVFSQSLPDRIKSVEWNPDGRLVAIAPYRGSTCLIVDAVEGTTVAEMKPDRRSVMTCRWSPDGRKLGIVKSRTFVTTDVAGTVLSRTPLPVGSLMAFDWLDNHSILASPEHLEGLHRISLEDNSSAGIALHQYCRSTFLRSRGALTVVASGTGTFQISDGDIRAFPPIPDDDKQVWSLGITGGQQPVVVSAGLQSLQYSTRPDAPWQNGGGPQAKPADISCHPLKPQAAVLYENGEVWLLNQGQQAQFHRELKDVVFDSQIAWSPDGKMLACGLKDRLVVWDPTRQTDAFEFDWKLFQAGGRAAWSPDSEYIATSSMHGIRVLSLETREEVALLKGQTHYFTRSIAWSPDGRKVAAMTEAWLRLWDTDTWQQSLVIPVNVATAGCRPLAWHPSGKSLLLATSDGAFREYDSTTGECLRVALLLDPDRYALFSPDGTIQQSTGLDDELVVIVQGPAGQQLLAPADFEKLSQQQAF